MGSYLSYRIFSKYYFILTKTFSHEFELMNFSNTKSIRFSAYKNEIFLKKNKVENGRKSILSLKNLYRTLSDLKTESDLFINYKLSSQRQHRKTYHHRQIKYISRLLVRLHH